MVEAPPEEAATPAAVPVVEEGKIGPEIWILFKIWTFWIHL